MHVNAHDTHLEDLKYRSVDRLMMAEVYDAEAFEALRSYLVEKGEALRSEYTISKQVLACLLQATSVIKSRAEYLPEVRGHLAMAEAFSSILYAMVAGETCQPRVTGVPRVW
jgi:hypothetical protein